MHRDPNLEMLQLVVERLGPLADRMVFLGGCATGLLVTDPAAGPIRETRDVDVIVDVMATRSDILGFSSRWYPVAMRTAEQMLLPNGSAIRLVSAPYFLATKLEAFYGRSQGDYMASHDLEDMLAVLDGRETIVSEVSHSEAHPYLAGEFGRLLTSPAFLDALPCHLPGDIASQLRAEIILRRMQSICSRA